MKISTIQLKNFKRFSDLKIKKIPQTAKLVVVIGPNGCGKSSLFDAMLQWYRQNAGFGAHNDEKYFRKDSTQQFNWGQNVQITESGSGLASLHLGCPEYIFQEGFLSVPTAAPHMPSWPV